ncbi:MAG: glycerophosphodiester phosphodiesterase family protein [Acutalibacteraceae bacterium]
MLNIAYSGLANLGMYRPNTMEVFLSAKRLGFKIIKADIRVSSDGEFILCHDRGFTCTNNSDKIVQGFSATADNTIAINDTPRSELMEYKYNTFDNLGYYSKVAEIDDFLQICREFDLIPFITVREEFASVYSKTSNSSAQYFGAPAYTRVGEYLAKKLLGKLDKYNLRKVAIINSFVHDLTNFITGTTEPWIGGYDTSYPFLASRTIVDFFRALDDDITILWTMSQGTSTSDFLIQRANSIKDVRGNNAINLYLENNVTGIENIKTAIEYSNSVGVPVYNSIINDYNVYHKMAELGMTGAQCERPIVEHKKKIYDLTLKYSNSEWTLCDTLWYGIIKGQGRYTAVITEKTENGYYLLIDGIAYSGSIKTDESGQKTYIRGFADALLKGWLSDLPNKISVSSDTVPVSASIADKQIKIDFPNGAPANNTVVNLIIEIL